MRPRLVDALYSLTGSNFLSGLVPLPTMMYAVAMLAVLIVYMGRCKVIGLSRYHAAGMAFAVMVGGLIGAHVFYMIQHLDATLAGLKDVYNMEVGSASWGAYLGGIFGFSLYYFRFNHIPAWRYADVLGSCLGLGMLFGRWSCFLNGDDYGTLSNLPWAVRYPHASMPFVAQVQAGLLDPMADLSLPVHPVQLYFSFNGLLLFMAGTIFWKRFPHRPGATFCLFWMSYCLTRFIGEFFRGDQYMRVFSLTVPQGMAILVFLAAAFCLWYLWRRWRIID